VEKVTSLEGQKREEGHKQEKLPAGEGNRFRGSKPGEMSKAGEGSQAGEGHSRGESHRFRGSKAGDGSLEKRGETLLG
jgi:hypothetical protein